MRAKDIMSQLEAEFPVTETEELNQRSYADDPKAFKAAFNKWFLIAKKRIEHHWRQSGYTFAPPPELVVEMGKRYWRIMRKDQSQSSAHAFIDTQNGNVYKPATWKAPAKHARGNIFDPDNGAAWMGPHGPAYLR